MARQPSKASGAIAPEAKVPPAPETAKPKRTRPPVGGDHAVGWWTLLCAGVAVATGVAAAVGALDHAAGAVVVGAAVVAAPARPRRVEALAGAGAILGIAVAALFERPAPLAGVAVAAAAAQLAFSPRGRARAVGAGLLVATVAAALALREAGAASVGGSVEGGAGVVLVVAALAAALLGLPRHGGGPALPTAAVVCSTLAVCALGVTGGGAGAAAVAALAALAFALDRRLAAALVAAAVACAATPALAAGALALVAAAVAASLAPVAVEIVVASDAEAPPAPRPPPAWGLPRDEGAGGWPDQGDEIGAEDDEIDRATAPRDDDGEAKDGDAVDTGGENGAVATEALPSWVAAAASLPAAAAALDVAAGRTPEAVLALAALAVVGVPALLDRSGGEKAARSSHLPRVAAPAAVLAGLTLAAPGRIGWAGDPLRHWPAGVGCAAFGLAVALVLSSRTRGGPRSTGSTPPRGGRAGGPGPERPHRAGGPGPERPHRAGGPGPERPHSAGGPGPERPPAAGKQDEVAPGGSSAMGAGSFDNPPAEARRRRRRRRR